MGYTEVNVFVEGIAEETQIFLNGQEEEMDNVVESTKQFARDNNDMAVHIYTLYHGHDPLVDDDECMCIQFLTDHKPMWSSK